MYWILLILAGVLGLVAFVCQLIIIVKAFQSGALDGILTLLFWPYALYFAFAKLDSPNKGKILAGWLGGAVAAGVLAGVSMSMMQSDMQAVMAAEMQKLENK